MIKIIKITVISIILLPILIFSCLVAFDVISHNNNLNSLEKSFNNISHPKKTELITNYKQVGILVGNGNHCDYFVGELRRSKLTTDEIQNLYNREKSISYKRSNNNEIRIDFYTKNELPNKAYALFDYDDLTQLVDDIDKDYNYYLIYVFDVGDLPGYDPRCH